MPLILHHYFFNVLVVCFFRRANTVRPYGVDCLFAEVIGVFLRCWLIICGGNWGVRIRGAQTRAFPVDRGSPKRARM